MLGIYWHLYYSFKTYDMEDKVISMSVISSLRTLGSYPANLWETFKVIIGNTFRDKFFFPDPNLRFSKNHIKACKRKKLPDSFKEKEIKVQFSYNGESLEAKVCIYYTDFPGAQNKHTTIRFGGNAENNITSRSKVIPFLKAFHKAKTACEGTEATNLHLINVSFYDISNGNKSWKFPNDTAVADVAFEIMKKIKEKENYPTFGSLMVHSVGGMVFLNSEKREFEDVPKILILDRSFTSVEKTAKNILPWTYRILNFFARASGWGADPKKSLVEFFLKNKPASSSSVIICRVEHDVYFLEPEDVASNLTKDLKACGVAVF